jgi:hypothetical protein
LFKDLQSLPKNAALRKLNDLIKRARLAKVISCISLMCPPTYYLTVSQVHGYIISSLKNDMPSMFGKDSKKKELIKNLNQVYEQLEKQHGISRGDFPDIKKLQVC